MPRIAAYILTSMEVPERVADARRLAQQLEALEGIDRVECLPSIFWTHPEAAAAFLERHPRHSFTDDFARRAFQGQVCCTLTHLNTWYRLLDTDLDGAMVFEDDMRVTDPEGLEALIQMLDAPGDIDWLRIHLHGKFRPQLLDEAAPLAMIEDPSKWGFAGYFLTRQGATQLLDLFSDINEPVDKVVATMGHTGQLRCRSVNHVLVDYHPFEGAPSELLTRHRREQQPFKQQKLPSTIYASPPMAPGDRLYHYATDLPRLQSLQNDGVTVLDNVFDEASIEAARQQVLAQRDWFPNTRPSPSSSHLASFHRYPELESLHTMLTGQPRIRHFLELAMGGKRARSIGLSDITINRSQHWHKDLLRGRYQTYLEGVDIWQDTDGQMFKILVYLQEGNSLKIIRGSHQQSLLLDDDRHAEPGPQDDVMSVPVQLGDVVIMDIRCSHCGSDESVFASGAFDEHPKILVSTALGVDGGRLTDAMEQGNHRRLIDWQSLHRLNTG